MQAKISWQSEEIDSIYECASCEENIYSKMYYPVIDVFIDGKLKQSENAFMVFCESCYDQVKSNDLPD